MDAYERELLERGVAAIERLAQDPVIEIETKPPACPHCEKINPMVRIGVEEEAIGPMAEFVIKAQCLNCNKLFYALPDQWSTVASVAQAAQVMQERLELRGFNQN